MESKRDVQISKTLAYLLRHGAVKEKLPIDNQGWIELSQLLAHQRLKSHKATDEDVARIVANNEKQRFSLKQDNGITYICANQGHTLSQIEPDLILLTSQTMPSRVYHGTYISKMPSILETGLSRMQRNHIHMTSDADWSKLGIRNNCDVLIYINTEAAMAAGLDFYRSKNGVVLCSGDSLGHLPADFFAQIEYK